MSGNPDSDQLWIEFLSSLYDDSLYKESEESEEVNDPEYNISEDLLQLDDDWDLRDERAVKVPDYELDLLLDEEDNEMEVQTVDKAIVETTQEVTDGSQLFNKVNVRILMTQLSQHIQLLTQTYIQSMNSNGLQSVAQNANSMLNEINNYCENKNNSIFCSTNIKASIRLINEHPIDSSSKKSQSMTSWRSLPVTKENQRIFSSNPEVFIHPWLLPYCGYYDKRVDKNKSKTLFTLAEDNLIALGLEELTPLFSLRKCYRYLKQLLLPIKTVDQIRTHIKNIKRRSSANDCHENPIVYQSLNGKAPETHSGIIDPKLDTYLFCKYPPEWYKKAIKAKESKSDSNERRETGISGSCGPKSKKFKSANLLPIEKKKAFILPQQSPVKQTNSIVKKYKYLNRLNTHKQNLSVISNTSLRTKTYSNDSNLSQIEIIDISNENCVKNNDFNQIYITEDIKNTESINEIHNQSPSNVPNEEKSQSKPLNDNQINEEDNEFDDESDLAALMTASSTITTKNKNKSKTSNDLNNSTILSLSHNKKEGRKSSAVKQRESTLQLLSFECNENDPYCRQKEDLLIQIYLEKVRKCLSYEDFISFLTLLTQFLHKRNADQINPKKGLIKTLYSQIEEFLNKSNVGKDIINEFVLFLSAEQAEECGKMFDYLYWKRFFNFVRKLEIYSSIDSQCLHRLYRSLNQLKQNEENFDKNKIRSIVSRSLNGQSYLMHEFSSLILDEKPSEYLFEDQDFNEVIIDSSDEEDGTDSSDKLCFENIIVPENEEELKYGTNECPCRTCHTEPTPSQATTKHCTSCSIRFIGGRVYLTQNHKKLGLAEIHFKECDNNLNKSNTNIENNKQMEDLNEEEVCIESDNENEFENNRVLDKKSETKVWTITDDQMLLELCRSKVIEEKYNDLSEEVFEEVANKLSKGTNEVIARFNKLMALFASEQDSLRLNSEPDQ